MKISIIQRRQIIRQHLQDTSGKGKNNQDNRYDNLRSVIDLSKELGLDPATATRLECLKKYLEAIEAGEKLEPKTHNLVKRMLGLSENTSKKRVLEKCRARVQHLSKR